MVRILALRFSSLSRSARGWVWFCSALWACPASWLFANPHPGAAFDGGNLGWGQAHGVAILRSIKHLCLRQTQTSLVFGRQLGRQTLGPSDANRRVVPGNAAFVCGGVIVRRLIQEVGRLAQHHKAVGKARWHPELAVVVFGQLAADPLAKSGRAFADVHGHVKHGAAHHAHQLALGLLQLVVQAAQHALGAAAVVVLHNVHIQAGDFGKVLRVEAFKKEAPAVAKNLRLKDQDVGDGGGGGGVGHHFNKFSRYCP